jgi:hypothetical protein
VEGVLVRPEQSSWCGGDFRGVEGIEQPLLSLVRFATFAAQLPSVEYSHTAQERKSCTSKNMKFSVN